MTNQEDNKKIKKIAEEFFKKMTIAPIAIEVGFLDEIVSLDIKLEEPQILIGEKGQTLFEIQRLLKTILNKKLQKIFYLNLDINDYKKKKTEYLKDLAKSLADEVTLTREEKILLPMPSYERRIIHTELSQRTDIITESQGEGPDRHIIIKPK
ncbi:MAG: R3H domain-containing nucleic acid-binding protein [Patescibacteria group bacterium]